MIYPQNYKPVFESIGYMLVMGSMLLLAGICLAMSVRGDLMKLFFWDQPYPVSYGQSSCFAVAETVEQARGLLKNGTICAFNTPSHKQGPMTVELGEPDRVLDLPCAEWHHWEE